MEGWKKLLLAAGGAASVAAFLYYLIKEDPESDALLKAEVESAAGGAAKGSSGKDLSKKELLELLKDMAESQKKFQAIIRGLVKEMAADPHTFEQTLQKIKASEPEDPLDARGLTMADLDTPLQKFQNDPEVMMSLSALMGMDKEAMEGGSEKAGKITVNEIIEVHKFQLKEIANIITSYKEVPNNKKFDKKIVMQAVQATLDCKVLEKFGFESTDMHSAIMGNQQKLAASQEFMQINMQMQGHMEELMAP